MELTPLCGPKIAAILKAGFGPHAFLIYRCGAAQRQAVGLRQFRTAFDAVHLDSTIYHQEGRLFYFS
jgi:hypothetical protein